MTPIKLPLYQSHKKVRAAKIDIIILEEDGSATLYTEYGPIHVSEEYVKKHQPKAGGYFVQYINNYVPYESGYESWSPADVFEDGYTLIDNTIPWPVQERLGPKQS